MIEGFFVGAYVAAPTFGGIWRFKQGDKVGMWCCAFMAVSGIFFADLATGPQLLRSMTWRFRRRTRSATTTPCSMAPKPARTARSAKCRNTGSRTPTPGYRASTAFLSPLPQRTSLSVTSWRRNWTNLQ